jgi:hypothetical protein
LAGETDATSLGENYAQLVKSLQRVQDKLEKIDPSGLVTFSVRGLTRTIERQNITRWTNTLKFNWFAHYLAEHEGGGKKVDEPIFINRNPLAFDWILDLLAARDVDFSILNPDMQVLLLKDLSFYQIEEIADKHLKNRNSKIGVLRSVNSSRKLKLLQSAGRVCYLTNRDSNCCPEQSISSEKPTVITTVSVRSFDEFEVVLISAYQNIGVTNEILGNILADFVDKGGNVVFCFYSNNTSHCHAAGRFAGYNPFKLNPHAVSPVCDWMAWFDKEHPLMQGVDSITQTGEKNKVHGELNEGIVEVVAKWSDGSNMIAIRHDRKGLITSLGFSSGWDKTAGDVTKLLLNAIRLRKCD